MSINRIKLFSKNTLVEKFFLLDFKIIFLVLLIGIISCFSMYSVDGGKFDYHTVNHIYRFTICFLLFLMLSFVKINFWHKYSYIIYFIVLVLLIGVEFFGITASGSKRWIDIYAFNLQPSELMKISIIIFLAKFYHRISFQDVSKLKYLAQPLAAILIPFFLVVAQPDLGTSILIAAGGIVMMWISGISLKYFFYSSIVCLSATPVVIALLKPYQKLRILTFFDPERDPLGAGYQIIQSKIAVGSGGISGKGFLKGTQSYLDYLPEKHTDFIFTLFSEQFGFFGSVFLLILYFLLILNIIHIGSNSRSYFAKLFCYGFASSIFIYVSVNLSMVLGLLPIVGSPLPIMSYGGSAMLSIMFGLSVVMSSKIYKDTDIA